MRRSMRYWIREDDRFVVEGELQQLQTAGQIQSANFTKEGESMLMVIVRLTDSDSLCCSTCNKVPTDKHIRSYGITLTSKMD